MCSASPSSSGGRSTCAPRRSTERWRWPRPARARLDARLGRAREIMRGLSSQAQQQEAQRIVFPEGEDPRILKAARILADEGIAAPILLGDPDVMRRQADDAGVTLEDIALANPRTSAHLNGFAQELWERRRRKGITLREARARVLDPMYHALLMLQAGQADAVVAGVDMYYARSEEHTSELQSHVNLVCRLL